MTWLTREQVLAKGLEIDLLDLAPLVIENNGLINCETGERVNMKPFGKPKELRYFNRGIPEIKPVPQDAEGYIILESEDNQCVFGDFITMSVQFYKSN